MTSHEQKVLEELEKDLKAVRKAREALGDKAPAFRREGGGAGGSGFRDGGRSGGVLGKRRRDDGAASGSDSDVPEDVKAIPMPRDTPPPIPKEVLDKWYQARRERNQQHQQQQQGTRGAGTSANNMPLGGNARVFGRAEGEEDTAQQPKPVVEARTVYEAAPEIRDLRKEAVSAFLPAAVRLKMEKAKGKGGLVEPEEADALEREGYLGGGREAEEETSGPKAVMMEEVDDEDDYQ